MDLITLYRPLLIIKRIIRLEAMRYTQSIYFLVFIDTIKSDGKEIDVENANTVC